MRKLALVLTALLVPLCVFSQLENFDLSSYKYPDVKIRKLDFRGAFTGGYYTETNHISPIEPLDDSFDKGLRSNNLFASFAYSSFVNKRSFQQNIEAHFASDMTLGNQWGKGNLRDELFVYGKSNLDLKWVNRHYKKNRWFFQYGSLIDLNYNERSTIDVNGYYGLNIGGGYGRIEPVEDARLSVYILETIVSNKKSKTSIENEDVLQLAEEISKLKRKRRFDPRLGKIRELVSLDSVLNKMDLVNEGDMAFYGHLADEWDHSSGPQRWNGSRILMRMDYGYLMSFRLDRSFNSTDKWFSSRTPIRINYENHKPINLYWQRQIKTSIIIGGHYYTFTEDEKTYLQGSDIALNANGSVAYYPNSRTSLSASLGLLTGRPRSWHHDEQWLYNGLSFYPNTGMIINYYLSPRLRINVNLNSSYLFVRGSTSLDLLSNTQTQKKWNTRIYASLLYSIF